MDTSKLRLYLDSPAEAAGWLRSLGVVDVGKAHANLVRIATAGLPLDLLSEICDQLAGHLPGCPDPDMALNNLERFFGAARNPLAVGTWFQRDREALPILLQICSTSQHLSDLLIVDPESFDLLRVSEGKPASRRALVEEIGSEVAVLDHDQAVLSALRRFKRRHTLRIAYGDIVVGQSLAVVTTQISFLADAILEAALAAAWRRVATGQGTPRGPHGEPARFVVLALGKLGGVELNYSSDIDLVFLYDVDGTTDSKRHLTNREFFGGLARELLRLLTEPTELGVAYRVDLRLRPDGRRGPITGSLEGALHYYDLRGRTWERQALIKARPAAGDLELGVEFLRRLRPWIYRRYLHRADITGIKALKRRIEQHARATTDHATRDQPTTLRDHPADGARPVGARVPRGARWSGGGETRNVKTGHGGIRDIEFVIQFLQLLNGGDRPELRTANTLEAIVQLENVGCLTDQERSLLEANYGFLRKIEHRLQIMFDMQTHLLPKEPNELRKLALRMGYSDVPRGRALAAFEEDYRGTTAINRRILDHLLHDAFSDDADTAAEVDLVLDPDPPQERIEEVLGKYPFRDVKLAYRNLMALAEEKIRFLSTRRCRHFLAAIAPELLKAIAATADPDSTLVNLDKVSDSLGGKGVLWELFSFNQPSLHLYVRLCAYSPYLSGILISNPGMIDGLMDSLVLDKLPTRRSLERTLADLCRRAEDLDPILHSFKNDQQLRVGVRDILGKEDIQATTGTLSDIAEVCLAEIARSEYQKLAAKFGEPTAGEGRRAGKPAELVILAMGKFGGREMNYHSDLDIVLLYEADGLTTGGRWTVDGGRKDGLETGDRRPAVHGSFTQPPVSSLQSPATSNPQSTTNQHFYSELGQRIIKTTSRLSAYGRLYEVDVRLRPTGKSGALATSLDEFSRYFAEGSGRLWERQALCKARVVVGSKRLAKVVVGVVGRAAFEHRWHRSDADEIRHMRHRLEETTSGGDLKRGPGGIVDVEFLVQMLQLKYGRRSAKIRTPNTLDALAALHQAGHLADEDFRFFTDSYLFLRTLEGRLRLLNSTARDKLPDDPTELAKLAQLLRCGSSEALLSDFERYTQETRHRFNRFFDVAGTETTTR